MEKVLLYQMDSLYRDSFKIYGYHFGGNEKTVCIVGAIRGNEIQQLYMCSNLIKTLKLLEERRCLDENLGIMIVPSVNPYSLNTSTRFWATDNTDINRMFPGYENVEVAKEFAMPYIMLRNPKPYDTTTLNYEWQVWGTQAFSIYIPGTDQVDVKQARYGIDAVIRFLAYHGLIHMKVNGGYRSRIVEENELVTVRTKTSGILVLKVKCGDHLSVGDEIAEIIDTYEGDVIEVIKSPCEGFMLRNPKPYDTTTLNYEWQVWGTQAFSIYIPGTDQVDVKQARYGIDAVIRFLAYHGLIHMKVNGGYRSRIVEENELVTVRTKTSGILVLKVKCGDHLSVGDEIAEIIDTYEGDVIEVIKSPCEGCLFYHGSNPLIYSNTAIAKIIKDTDFI